MPNSKRRLINAAYEQHYFIHEPDRHIAESWEVVRDNLSRDKIKYTRLIDRYEEYRNIIYGNNKGLGVEFRKYALLESKQYQNIPRAIQHVFLNYKVESDFIKDTIIKSLNEEEIPIDLTTYKLHLKDFETQLNDIRLWTEKTTKGENKIRKLADSIIDSHSIIRFIEQDFKRLSAEVMYRLKENEHQQSKLNAALEKNKEREQQIADRLKRKEEQHEERKRKLVEEKGVFVNKLKEARDMQADYERMDIQKLIARVERKPDLLQERQSLLNQKILLETNFKDVTQRYELQIGQLNNLLESYKNNRQEKLRQLDKQVWEYKEMLFAEYEDVFAAVRAESAEKIQYKELQIEEKKEELGRWRNKLFEARHSSYYEQEINDCREKISLAKEQTQQLTNSVARLENENTMLKTQWELQEQNMRTETDRKQTQNNERIGELAAKIVSIRERITNSRDSLYGWLNEEYPGWENTIGKVVDEETVLFNSNLSPRKIDAKADTFYGIRIELDEIKKEVKTVADYESDILALEDEISAVKAIIRENDKLLDEQQEALKKKYLPRIRKNKEEIDKHKYNIEQEKRLIEKVQVELSNWYRRAENEKKTRLEEMGRLIDKATVEKEELVGELELLKRQIEKKIKSKQKEKETKMALKHAETEAARGLVNEAAEQQVRQVEADIAAVKERQTPELETKGAETKTIGVLANRLQAIDTELQFVDEQTEVVFNYRRDKKDLFDKVDFFKTQRDLLDDKLRETVSRYEVAKKKLLEEREELVLKMEQFNQQLAAIDADNLKSHEFQLMKAYSDYADLFVDSDEKRQTDKTGVKLIEEFIAQYYARLSEFNNLRERANKFCGNFSENNIFKFTVKLTEEADYLQFAETLSEFIDEDKISEYEKRVNELFAHIIKQIGNETEQLLSKENAIRRVIHEINNDFVKRIFTGVIKSIELRMIPSSNKIVQLLGEIKRFNDENIFNLGEMNLFTVDEQSREENNKKAIQYLSALSKAMIEYRAGVISLSDSFELEFKVIENDNDTGWVDKLANVGSDGTDVLVKAMINIMLLNVFKEGATRNQFKDFRLHCMMDEIGKLHPNNVRGILKFANDRNIFLVNGSLQSFDALAYKYTYKLSKQRDAQVGKDITIINRIITNNRI